MMNFSNGLACNFEVTTMTKVTIPVSIGLIV